MGDYAEQTVKNTARVIAIGAIDITAGANGTPVCCKHADHCTVMISTGAWAGGNCTITLTQDTSVTPTGAVKALAFTTYWTNDAAVGSNAMVETVCASTFNVDTANALYQIEIDMDSLDADNNFDCLRVVAGNPAQADFISIDYLFTQLRYAGPSATIKDFTID